MAKATAAPAAEAAGVESTPEPTPSGLTLADIQSLIVNKFTELTEDLAAVRSDQAELREKVERSEAGVPSFRPSDPTLNPQSIDSAMKLVQPGGDPISGQLRYVPIGTDSHVLSDEVAGRFIQEFDAGDRVQLNRAAQRKGHPKTWGEIADEVGQVDCPTVVRKRKCPGTFAVGQSCPRCGFGPTVKKVYWFEPRTGQWCYEVRFHGMTGVNGMMFFGNELLPR